MGSITVAKLWEKGELPNWCLGRRQRFALLDVVARADLFEAFLGFVA